jgi:CheY-like chemotaxis protein
MMRPQILIVDDDAAVRRALQRLLLQSGYKVLTAAGAEEACAHLENVAADVVLLDLRMPDMSGRTVYHIIVSRWPYLQDRIVIMTGGAQQGDEWVAMQGLPLVEKPFEVAVLLDRIARMLARRREANG